MKKGFDNEKYLKMQSAHIRERIDQFDNKLYLEFGGNFSMIFTLPAFFRDFSLTVSCACSSSFRTRRRSSS